MADVGLTEYERLRAENIRRNDVILASVRRKADELSAAIRASGSPALLRRSLRLSQPPPDAQAQPTPSECPRRAPPKPTTSKRRRRRRAPPQHTLKPRSTRFSPALASTILEAVSLSPGAAKLRASDFDAGKELVLTPANVRTLLPGRILGLLVLPLVDRTVVAAGDKSGNVAFWHANPEAEAEAGVVGADEVFEYLPHRGAVAAIVAHPALPHKIYSCSYKGEICLMDIEKENFSIAHSCDSPVYSLCQAPDSASCLYFGDGTGVLKLFDDRMGKVSATWDSHDNTINSIDFHPEKNHMVATGSTDRTARIWDLRRPNKKKEDCLKIYSCSYKGEICLMDIEKENFSIAHSCDSPVYSLCQAPDSASCLYFGDGTGVLKLFDDRMGKVSATWDSHDNTINSIDFHPEKNHMVATGSTDRTARIWDLRRPNKKKEDCLKVLEHSRSVHSAYFSPSGRMLATTSLEDTVQVFQGDDFDSLHIIKHNNQTGRWLSTFKAIWGWNDADLFIGNMKRAIDAISVGRSDGGLSASNSACLESEHMAAIPCRFSAHPYKVGHLACASSNGKVFLWTRA